MSTTPRTDAEEELLAANADLITVGAELSATADELRAENAELRRQVALDDKVKLLLSKYNGSERERADGLTLENAELRKDKARMDWLDARGPWDSWNRVGEEGVYLTRPIRAAIDAAMEGEK